MWTISLAGDWSKYLSSSEWMIYYDFIYSKKQGRKRWNFSEFLGRSQIKRVIMKSQDQNVKQMAVLASLEKWAAFPLLTLWLIEYLLGFELDNIKWIIEHDICWSHLGLKQSISRLIHNENKSKRVDWNKCNTGPLFYNIDVPCRCEAPFKPHLVSPSFLQCSSTEFTAFGLWDLGN